MFGTFQPKIANVEPVFGVTQPVHSWNPIKIDFMIWIQMLQDFFSTRSLRQKLGVLVSRTGRRPEDAAAMHPAEKIEDVFHFEKYKPEVSSFVFRLCVVEFVLALSLQMFFFYKISSLARTEVLLFGGFILLTIAAYTTVMEGRRASVLLSLRFLAYLTLMAYWQGDWFGINSIAGTLSITLAAFYAAMIPVSYFLNAPGQGLSSRTQTSPGAVLQ
jgi:hypothetical protein